MTIQQSRNISDNEQPPVNYFDDASGRTSNIFEQTEMT